MIVRNDRNGFDTGVYQEISERGLKFGLTSLEIVTNDMHFVLASKIDDSWNESVLWWSVNESATFQDATNSVSCRGWDIGIIGLNGLLEVCPSVVLAFNDFAKAFGVSWPHDDDLVAFILFLKFSNIFSDLLHMSPLTVSFFAPICSFLLVSSNEFRVIDASERFQFLHVRLKLTLQIIVNNLGSSHSISKVHVGDVPSA